jgi:hypothetical protein
MKMGVQGYTKFMVENGRGDWVVVRAIVSESLNGPCLISWKTQVELDLLPQTWPRRKNCHVPTFNYDEVRSVVEDVGDKDEEKEIKEPKVWPPTHLPEGIRNILREYSDVFVDKLSPNHYFKCPPLSVELMDPTQTFHCNRPRQNPIHWEQTISKELEKLEEAGIIKKI